MVFSGDSACCVVLASEGYPQKYETGYPVTLDPLPADAYVYYAGVKRKETGALVTAGGRVLGVTAYRENAAGCDSERICGRGRRCILKTPAGATSTSETRSDGRRSEDGI